MKNFQKNLYYLFDMYYNIIKTSMEENNMTNFLNLQISVFGSFNYIKASPENVMNIMNMLKAFNYEFLPNTIINQNIDIQSGKIEPESRISFISLDQKYNFVIHNERIDFNCQPTNLNTKTEEEFLESEFEFSHKILNMLISEFKILGHRLAININIIGNNIINNKIEKYCKKTINFLKFYNNKYIYEWSYNINARDKITIVDKKEELNIITNLNPVDNVNNKEKRILCHFDINTLGENTIQRFGFEELKIFCDGVKPIIINLIKDFKEFDEND